MNWLRNNLTIVACVAAFTALMGVAGWQIHKSYGRRRAIEADLQAKQESIQQLRGAKIFPSKENIEALHRDRLQLLEIYTNLQQKVSLTTITVPPINRDTDFNLFLVETQTALRKAAGGNNTNLDNFAFGFSRYQEAYPCRNAKVRGGDCEKLLGTLGKQIKVVEKIMRLLFESGTDGILEIKRAEIPPESPGADTIPWTAPADPKALYTAMPFQFKFTCNKTETLQTFLNKLTAADLFFVVKNLAIETDVYTVASTQPPSPFVRTGDEQIKGEARYRLLVTARIDWVEFASTASVAPNAAPTPAK